MRDLGIHQPGCDCTLCDFAASEIARLSPDTRTCDGCDEPWGYCTCADEVAHKPDACCGCGPCWDATYGPYAAHVQARTAHWWDHEFDAAFDAMVTHQAERSAANPLYLTLVSDRPIPGHGLAHDLDDTIPF